MKSFKSILYAAALLLPQHIFATTLAPVQLLNPTGSAVGQAIVSTGASTAPGWAAIVDSVLAGSGVAVSGATGNVTVSLAQIGANTLLGNATGSTANVTAVAVTGCNGAAQALQWTNGSGFGCNSSVATSGANANITSLTGLSTPLSVSQGGTSSNTLAQYNILAGNGTSAISAISPGTSGWVLTSNGASSFPTFQAIPGQPGRLLNIQVFTASGTYTPTSGTTKIVVEVQAPGGGSGGVPATSAGQNGVAGGGAAGSYARVYYTSGVTSQTVTIGAAGAAGAAGANPGGTGGTTSFGSLISCPGGPGGTAGAVSSGAGELAAASGFAAAPTISGGITLNTSVGQEGGQGVVFVVGSTLTGGNGGTSQLGQSPVSGYVGAVGATPGKGYGSGASGGRLTASLSAIAGASGAPGIIIVLEYQ